MVTCIRDWTRLCLERSFIVFNVATRRAFAWEDEEFPVSEGFPYGIFCGGVGYDGWEYVFKVSSLPCLVFINVEGVYFTYVKNSQYMC